MLLIEAAHDRLCDRVDALTLQYASDPSGLMSHMTRVETCIAEACKTSDFSTAYMAGVERSLMLIALQPIAPPQPTAADQAAAKAPPAGTKRLLGSEAAASRAATVVAKAAFRAANGAAAQQPVYTDGLGRLTLTDPRPGQPAPGHRPRQPRAPPAAPTYAPPAAHHYPYLPPGAYPPHGYPPGYPPLQPWPAQPATGGPRPPPGPPPGFPSQQPAPPKAFFPAMAGGNPANPQKCRDVASPQGCTRPLCMFSH